MSTHRFIGHKAQSTDRKQETGIISFYNPDNGEMNITYNNNKKDVLITHISKCKIVTN